VERFRLEQYLSFQTGIQGLTGILGIDGQTGIQGLTGILGIDGNTGIQGDTGIQGLTGILGIDGQTGIQGLTGIRGLTVIYGLTGIQGLTGFYGLTGIQGLTGVMAGVTGVMNFVFNAGAGNLLYPSTAEVVAPFNYKLNSWTVLNGVTGLSDYDVNRCTAANYSTMTALGATGIGTYGVGGSKATDSKFWTGSTGLYGDIIQVKLVGVTGIASSTLAISYNTY
jgi:hypothetical protein